MHLKLKNIAKQQINIKGVSEMETTAFALKAEKQS
jgi:hypothetical protein